MESNTTTTTTTGTGYSYTNYCFNRLPCGYCRILNSPCPVPTNTFTVPTWDPNWYKITCNTEVNNG